MRKELLIAALGIGVTGTLDAATRQEVERLLAQIAKSPAPQNLSLGALCYKMAVPPDRAEYVCPVCGTKTLYVREGDHSWRHWFVIHSALSKYRKHCEELRELGWDVTLDESFLCSKCRKPKEPQDLVLVVTIDKKATRTQYESDDLEKLVAFAKKKRTWKTAQDRERPLKDELPRLRKLLGVSESERNENAPEEKSVFSRIRELLGMPATKEEK